MTALGNTLLLVFSQSLSSLGVTSSMPLPVGPMTTLANILVMLFVCPGNQGVAGQEQVFRVRPQSVQVREGEDVVLRCAVENQQGNAQWTKDGFALGFERHVPGYPRYQYLGEPGRGEHHLVIKGVTLEDDGEYQCQVGPTMTSFPIWAAANLTVMVSPTSISVVGVGDGAEVEVVAGSSLQLECLVENARPAASVAWYRDALTLHQGLHEEVVEASRQPRRWNVRSRLVLHPQAEDDGQQYSCRALHPALQHSPTTLVASVNLAVLHPPGEPVISGYRTGEVLVEGEQRTLVCQVSGGRPRPWVTWYRHGRPLTFIATHHLPRAPEASGGATSAPDTSSGGAGTQGRGPRSVRVRLVVTAARPEDGAVYECRVSSDLLPRPLTTNVTLTVHYAPERATISGPSVVAAGQVATLTCRTSPSNPPATLTWRLEGAVVTSMPAVVSEEEGGGWQTTSELTHQLPRSQKVSQTTAQCQATHPAAHRPINDTHVINVIKRPGWPVVEVVGGEEVVAGDQVEVLCTSHGGNPPPALTIYKAGRKVAAVVEQVVGGVTQARALLQVTPSDNGQQLTCQVSNPATSAPMASHATITLQFPAWEVSGWVSPSSVEAGQVATLTCETSSSVPPSALTWRTDGGAPLPEGATISHSPGLFGGTITRSEVKVRAEVEENDRTFTCEADNGLGVTVATNVSLDVLHGPVWVSAPPARVDVEEGDDLTITALAVANPGPIRYSWWRGPAAIEGEESENGSGQLKLTRAHRHLSGNYIVIARSSHTAINSSFSINVQYSPEDVLAAERVMVDEDGAATILCSATGNPTPNITWTRDTDNISSVTLLSTGIGEARLVIEWASKEDTGIYLCHASNIISSPPPISTAIVVTQAPTPVTVSSEEEVNDQSWAPLGGSGWLDCHVKAAPAPTFRWTTDNDRVLSNSKKYSIHVPQLVDKVIEWSSLLEIRNITAHDFTDYICTTHNSRGSQTMNFTLSPPILPGVPMKLNITTVSSTDVVVMWLKNLFGAEPTGFTIRYLPTGDHNYEFVDVPGSNSTTSVIKGLVPGAQYSFSILAYNDHGYSDYSSPSTMVTMLGMVEEVASSSSVNNNQPRVPRLILLLISLTGTALLVLNISIIVCFLRRRAMKRNMSASSSKTSALEIYTPTSGAGTQGDELPLTSINDFPPPEYQSLRNQPGVDECERTSFTSPLVISEPPEPSPKQSFNTANPRSSSTSPLLNGGISVQNDRLPPDNDKLLPQAAVSTLTHGSSPKEAIKISKESNKSTYSTNKPDVCPVTSTSFHPLLQEQKSFDPYSEDDQASVSSHQSSDSYGYTAGQLHPKLQPPCPTPRPTTQVIYHGQPHIQQQLEQQHKQQQHQQQHCQQNLPCCQQQSPSQQQNQPSRHVSSLHSCLNPARLSTSTSSCCDASCKQSFGTDIPVGYATLQPRRSCLKPTQYNTLQRSHSTHSYTSKSLQCVYHHPFMETHTDIWCQNSHCQNAQLQTQSHRTLGVTAQEYPMYFARPSTISTSCSRHNSISGQKSYRNNLCHEPKWSTVPPDLCKVESSSTKRVGWKEVLHDSPEHGTLASRGSTDTSTSSTTSTITMGPSRFPQLGARQDNLSTSLRNVGMDDQR
ncbi:nephrin-like [Panulirus ornatus]|uniref:nephrin-like n=1 Tax=Panulirus ornatus TaxID=150431 RepID=UPI003A8C7F1E